MPPILPGPDSDHESYRASIDRLQRWGGDKLVCDLVTLFLTQTAERLTSLERALPRHDQAEAERIAHILKSGAAQLGLTHMSRLCASAEAAAARGDLDSVRTLLPALRSSYEAYQTWIATHLPSVQ